MEIAGAAFVQACLKCLLICTFVPTSHVYNFHGKKCSVLLAYNHNRMGTFFDCYCISPS